MRKLHGFLLLITIIALLFVGCGVDFQSQGAGGVVAGAAAVAAPANFAAGQANLQAALGAVAPPQVNFANQPVAGAAANKDGAVFGVVADANNDNTRLQRAAVGLRSVSNVDRTIFDVSETTNPLTYMGGMVFEDTGTTLYLLDTVAQPAANATAFSGVIYNVNTSNNAVTETNLGSLVDMPMGLAYVNTGSISNSLYFTGKKDGNASLFRMPVGGSPTALAPVMPAGQTLVEPTAIVANDTSLFIYDAKGSMATIYQVLLSNLTATAILSVNARPSAVPLAIADQSSFKALFFVDGEMVKMIDVSSALLAAVADNAITTIMPMGKMSEVSGLYYSPSDSTLLVSSETDRKVFKAVAGSSS